jgi:hypothetical protein
VIHQRVVIVLPPMVTLAPVRRRGAVIVLVASALACHRADSSRQSSQSNPPSISTASLPVPPPLPGDDDPAPQPPAPLPENVSLTDRLAREASSRPAGAVRSEALVEALKARGIAVTRTRQVLGKTLDARYCAIAVTAAGLVASVCEFDSEAAARAAVKDSEQRFGKPMPDRRFVTNGKSLLTIANLRDTVESEATTVAATFAALTAT